MNNATLTIALAENAGDGESRWIRLEQVPLPDEGVTMEQAADLIDELYGVEPCVDGLGNGGEAADEEALPEEEAFLDMARERLGLDMCDENASPTWETEVDVLRSHQDDAYSLEGARIEVLETTPMRKAVTETLEANGASLDLTWPCAGDVSVSGGAAVRDVRGSTVNFVAPVRGRVRVSYRAVWDRVRLKVSRGASGGGGPLAGLAFAVGGSATTASREEDAAAVVAFWRDLAVECSLTRPPADDQDIDRAELERLCGRRTDWHVTGECWQTVERYDICDCSGREAPTTQTEDVDAPCPDGVRPGSFLGVVRELRGYVPCEGEDDEGLNTPEFYEAHCCEGQYRDDLPRCRETREPHRGGAEIERGPAYWREQYGENVRLTAVAPEGGCGEIVKIWAVPDALEGPPVVPESLVVDPGEWFSVTVTSGGRAPFTWSTPPGVEFLGDAAYGFIGTFRADATFTGGTLVVVDACGREAACMLDTPVLCRWEQYAGIFDPRAFDEKCYISGTLKDAPYHRNADLLREFFRDINRIQFYNRYKDTPEFEQLCRHFFFSAHEEYMIFVSAGCFCRSSFCDEWPELCGYMFVSELHEKFAGGTSELHPCNNIEPMLKSLIGHDVAELMYDDEKVRLCERDGYEKIELYYHCAFRRVCE